MTLSNKVVVLLDGVVQQLDPPSRIYSHPANKFVAGFVGSPQINLLTLNCQENQAILGDFVIPLPNLPSSPDIIDLGIRPEDLKLATDSDQLIIEGEVFLVEHFGRELLVSMKVRGSNDRLRILIEPDQSWSKENLKVALNLQKINWFNAKTGERY